MNNICLIGAGALGIRHAEGLLKSSLPLSIVVCDPSAESRMKVTQLSVPAHNSLTVSESIPSGDYDLAIIATTSNMRAEVTRALLEKSSVRNILFEKLLFTRERDYESIGTLLAEKQVFAWVNCSLRLMPIRKDLQSEVSGKFSIHFCGGRQHGLMTNVVHYADYACFLAGESQFEVSTALLSDTVIDSKRATYKELLGSIELHFPNGSRAICTSLAHERPRRTILENENIRAVFDEATNKAHIARRSEGWNWQRVDAPFSYQSELTGPLVDSILSKGTCDLPSYRDSSRIHLQILNPVRDFLRASGQHFEVDYPFT
jgi:predicted dehydrogenase